MAEEDSDEEEEEDEVAAGRRVEEGGMEDEEDLPVAGKHQTSFNHDPTPSYSLYIYYVALYNLLFDSHCII